MTWEELTQAVTLDGVQPGDTVTGIEWYPGAERSVVTMKRDDLGGVMITVLAGPSVAAVFPADSVPVESAVAGDDEESLDSVPAAEAMIASHPARIKRPTG